MWPFLVYFISTVFFCGYYHQAMNMNAVLLFIGLVPLFNTELQSEW